MKGDWRGQCSTLEGWRWEDEALRPNFSTRAGAVICNFFSSTLGHQHQHLPFPSCACIIEGQLDSNPFIFLWIFVAFNLSNWYAHLLTSTIKLIGGQVAIGAIALVACGLILSQVILDKNGAASPQKTMDALH